MLRIMLPLLLILLLIPIGTEGLPPTMTYQGQLVVGDTPFTGPAAFKFVIVWNDATLWSNDATSMAGNEPGTSVPAFVENGVFTVLLGDPAEGMVPLSAEALAAGFDPMLRVWVDTGGGFEQLPDQPLASSPYALESDAARRSVGDFTVGGKLGVGTTPVDELTVAGFGRFDLGGGSVRVSTPGGWPGLILFSSNGNRRDIIIDDAGLRLLAGASSGAPGPMSGIRIAENGWVGVGVDAPTTPLHVQGTTRTGVLEITGGSDLSERFDIAGPNIEPGYTVCIDPEAPGRLVVSTLPYDRTVAGVVSGAGGVNPGMLMGQEGTPADGRWPVALTGRVWVWCDASAAPIEPGDLLTTSAVAGHAMNAVDGPAARGSVLGKAMTALPGGRGLVLALVALQ
jgi:hypothetical protein